MQPLRPSLLKINFHGTALVLPFTTTPLSVLKISPISVYLADHWLQIMHIALHPAILRITLATLTLTLLPATSLMNFNQNV